ncbi:MAG: dihydroorotase [Acidobacteria bacterium]|nr:MAG: dihydroorotase [Acidobacteriota bacterium]REK02181.1 MAG: dihydroorotase [Acidobacteriota bacterium]REK14017.1 MAG: dihydroorotase [Acidobacteriota bacterium]REK42012.1 MAG: dihydroorotase [Acidobacteriota bacterium]
MRLLIKNGHLVDPAAKENTGMNLLIENGRVSEWLRQSDADPVDVEVFDAGGCLIAPGFIDLHVHLREPGQEHKENIASGCAAAVAGGWTSICPMPNTSPINDNAAITRYMIEQAEHAGLANVFPIGAITKNSDGGELAEMAEMKSAGAVAVSDDGRPVPTAGMMRRAMQYARDHDLPVIDHCEDKSLSAGGVMHEGKVSLSLGLKGMPALAEDIDAVRDILLARETGAHIHVAHVSTRGAVNAVRQAKAEGVRVTCEVTPHHFTLTDKAVEGYDTNTKMAPPLRSEEHREAVIEGIRDGTIDAIATDHAPHHADEKALEFDRAPFGIIGLETAIGLAFNELVHKGVIGLERLVELCSSNPAKIFGLKDRGTLAPGSCADVTIIDPELEWEYDVWETRSKSRNSPFSGWRFRGGPVATFVGGKLVYERP